VRKKWVKILAATTVGWLFLTLITVRFGEPAVRAAALLEINAPPTMSEGSSKLVNEMLSGSNETAKKPRFYCVSRVYAPFIIRVDCGLIGGAFKSGGRTDFHVWFFSWSKGFLFSLRDS
jgi:hypothetical protein